MALILMILLLTDFFSIQWLARDGQWKEIVVLSVISALGIGLSLLMILGVDLPYFSGVINELIKKLFPALYKGM